ncbi:FAD-binding oxidoreductase [Labrys sp. KNU-23]|uniref:FAD-binding and (Fe-S)-binding domain-containing protein n=1 Tax=Labrys sp. KNU-23 TaxID=2789216 RepID=UPI0011EC7CE0|nr:FAD-binding and (Fe-S)-binding domain-containing protein [Labrys sp. KNU-23]QEN85506.1 FAD-binding oxidoreductase [Labrys sp. KNU-23]
MNMRVQVEDKAVPSGLDAFLSALVPAGYAGDIARDRATRIVHATDNSIYQVEPAAVLFARNGEDVACVVRLAAEHRIPLSPRGGGTGTNGQSLTRGVLVDTSRHMNRILELDLERQRVTVEPGVVLNQLNDYLQPYGLFFPPTVSTASRATLGGMVATDASGKGSRIYGKTSDYIEAMEIVLADGETFQVEAMPIAKARELARRQDAAGRIHREVLRVVDENAGLIASTFPEMNRGLTGYNLKHVLGEDDCFRLSYLLAGSEGTLAFTTRLTLRLRKRPACRALVPVRYATFQAALIDVQRLLQAEPAAIEILDDTILALARQDVVWGEIEGVLGSDDSRPVGGLNFVEFVGETQGEVDAALARLSNLLAEQPGIVLDWKIVTDAKTIAGLWSLREKAVGLLGRLGGGKQGTPFVEDTAVPPERLAPYVEEFRAILDRHGLAYGMFGHADVGCLHVRPALDMRLAEDAALIRPVSDAVAALTRKYGGLLWGEHGRGYRGEYSPFFFGGKLYDELCALKRAFDPLNLLNPGKLTSVDTVLYPVEGIDAVPLRGEKDRTIAAPLQRDYDRAIACNGNGACFNWDRHDPMCPSYKLTRDRRHSPKGRAAMLREWARSTSTAAGHSSATAEIEEELKTSLDLCLSCKACSSQCPVKVDIPAMKSRFLHRYFKNRHRPLRHRIVAAMEPGLALARRFPATANLGLRLMRASGLARRVGLTDLPHLSVPAPAPRLQPRDLGGLAADAGANAVILLEDSFASSFDGSVVDAVAGLLARLGFQVHRAAPAANGKALHVLGMLDEFAKVAGAARAYQSQLLATGLPVVGIEPVAVLMGRHEYVGPGLGEPLAVLGLDEFLAQALESGRLGQALPASGTAGFHLLPHCTEKTAKPGTGQAWTRIFNHFGLELTVPATGCCGMAGLFGHEAEHASMSKDLFAMSWAPRLDGLAPSAVLATGFSCRCQTERCLGYAPRHPAQALLVHLESLAPSPHSQFHQSRLHQSRLGDTR